MHFIKLIHKWTSVFVGIQFLFWLVSGFYFTIMEHGSGNKYKESVKNIAIIEPDKLIEPGIILATNHETKDKKVISVKIISILDEPYYLLTHQKGLYQHQKQDISLVHGYTGELALIDEKMASRLANASYNGPGEIGSINKMSAPISDFPKEKNDVWQINFDDEINTSVYINAATGKVVKHSNDDKRLADFFFMLHFMDYGSEGGFNSWQIILFAIVALWLTLTGMIWTIELGFNGQYKVSLFSKNKQLISVFKSSDNQVKALKFSEKLNLLDGLAKHKVKLPSTCEGGGVCGKCKIKLSKDTKITLAEQHHLTQSKLESGIRLACQHSCKDITEITLLN